MWGGAIGEERAVGKISISTPNPFEWVELVLYTAEIPKKGFNGAIFGVPNQQHIEANFGSREAVVEAVWKRLITLPLFPDLTDAQQDTIVAAIRSYNGGL